MTKTLQGGGESVNPVIGYCADIAYMEVVVAEFKAWPSIARLAREVTITEKIDGTNGAIHIERLKFDGTGVLEIHAGDVVEYTNGELTFLRLTAQSRTRLITVGDDNHGFARWVADNASGLAVTLGEGIHYGEWWGYKINRGYGLAKGDRRFSLFNTERWKHLDGSQVPGLWVVPTLATGLLWGDPWDSPIDAALETLTIGSSVAAPGYERPEGIVVFHTAGRVMFKYTLDGDGHKTEVKEDPFADIRATGTDRMTPLLTREEQEPLLTAIENEDYAGAEELARTATAMYRASNRAEGKTYWEGLV
jgi:hypothetical protein